MIEFSCHTWSFHDLPLSEALGTIARLGFRRVDLGSGTHLHDLSPRRILNELRLYNLRLSDFYLLLPRISLADESLRRKDIDLFKTYVPVLQALGTPGITLSPGLAHAPDNHDAYQRTVDALTEMVEMTALPISIEPHLDSMVETPESALKMLDAVPGLSLTLDWAQFACQGFSAGDIAPLLPHTRHVHLRQAAPRKLQTCLAEGTIDLRETLQLFIGAGYTGLICIEHLKHSGWRGAQPVNILRETAALRDALRALVKELQPSKS